MYSFKKVKSIIDELDERIEGQKQIETKSSSETSEPQQV